MWAQERRPDIVRQGVEAIVAAEIASGQPENMGDWDARFWPANARQAGIPTGTVPRAHALIVFQPGVLGAGSSGHIAYVQRVYPRRILSHLRDARPGAVAGHSTGA